LYNVCGGFAALIRQDRCRRQAGSSFAACESEATAKPLLYFYPIKDSLICRNSNSLNHWR